MQNMLNVSGLCDSSHASFKFVNALSNVEISATCAMCKRSVNIPFPSYVSWKAPWINSGKSHYLLGQKLPYHYPINFWEKRRENLSIYIRKIIVASTSARSLLAFKNSSDAAKIIKERAALEHAFGDAIYGDSKYPSIRVEGHLLCQDFEVLASNRHQDVTSLASQDTPDFNLQVYANRKINVIGKRKLGGELRSSVEPCIRKRCNMRKLNAGEGERLSVLVSKLRCQNTRKKKPPSLKRSALQVSNRTLMPSTGIYSRDVNGAPSLLNKDKPQKIIDLQARKTTLMPSPGIYSREINDRAPSPLTKDKPQTTSIRKQNSAVMDWRKVKHRLLGLEDEMKLAALAKPYKQLQTIRQELLKRLGEDPSDVEWAKAANLTLTALLEKLQTASAARTKLVHHNLRLVLFHAHKYEKGRLPLSLHDLCQAGVKGLLDAVDHFDIQKGCRFSTYAIFWVRTAIIRAVSSFGNFSSEPYNFAMHKIEIKNASMDLLFELQRPPTDKEIMERLGFKATRYKTILRSSCRTTSLNISPNEVIGERISNLADPSIARSQEKKLIEETLEDVLTCLTPQEKIVLIERYGLAGSRELSLREVGVKLNLSQEMVRRYEIRGLLQLKHLTHKK